MNWCKVLKSCYKYYKFKKIIAYYYCILYCKLYNNYVIVTLGFLFVISALGLLPKVSSGPRSEKFAHPWIRVSTAPSPYKENRGEEVYSSYFSWIKDAEGTQHV